MQTINSAKTSLNQIPALFKKADIMENHIDGFTLDYGGGKYDKAAKFLNTEYNIKNLVYDKFNRTTGHCDNVCKIARAGFLDAIFCCNVLNVINSDNAIDTVLMHIKSFMSKYTTVYIQIYPGNGSGFGKETTKGYQRNEIACKYRKFIDNVFEGYEIKRKGNLFIIKSLQ